MSNSVGYTPGTGALVAVENIAGVLHQRVKIGVGVTGTAVDVSTDNPMPITAPTALDVTVGNFPGSQTVSGAVSVSDPSTVVAFGPITTANTVLFAAVDTANEQSIQLQISGSFSGGVAFQASNDNSVWFSVQGTAYSNDVQTVDTLYGSDIATIAFTAKYFRAITTPDFNGSVSGSYSLRWAASPQPFVQNTLMQVDPSVSMPVAGLTPLGYLRRIAVADNGGVIPADGVVVQGSRNGAQAGTIVQLETTGYGTVVLQLAGTFTGTVTFQVSNDGSTYVSAVAWPVAGAAVPVTTATAAGQWLIAASGRFFRAQLTTAGSGFPLAIAVLKNFSTAFPTNIPSQNMAQVAGTAAVTAGVSGMLAVGGNIAEDTAATSNPLICGGIARTALPASTIISGDAIRQTFSVSGQLITKENAPGDLDFYVNATVTTNTQTAIRAAQASPIRQNVTGLTFQNTNATATTLTIQDGSTTLITFSVPASMTLPVQLDFPTPLRGTAATALNYIAGTTGASVLLNVTGFNSY
jgi:hypothetical protein